MPLVAEGSQFIGYAVGGLVEIEVVFSWPGLGREIVTAINTRDYLVAQGAFIYIGILVMVVYFIADLLAAALDPRLRRSSAH
jgi:ABC-type dipeptide/oligopeptide/nickel transport system permease component